MVVSDVFRDPAPDLVCIDPLPSWDWYQDMADFAETITDEYAGRRLARAIEGKGPSAGSKTSSTRSIRTCYRRGMPSAMPAPSAVPRAPGRRHRGPVK
jgi:hypothetical protein